MIINIKTEQAWSFGKKDR